MIVANETIRKWKTNLPPHWQVIPLKYVVAYNFAQLPDNTDGTYVFDYVDIGSVTYGKGIEAFQTMSFSEAPSRARRIVCANDVILSTVRTYLKATAKIPERDNPVVVSTGFVTMRADQSKILPNYLGYLVQSDGLVSEIECQSCGVSYPAINSGEIVKISIPLPPISEQNVIISYLNKKCNAIDKAVDRHKTIVEKLEQYRKAILTKAVMKGLNADAKMQDSSGFGSCPAHWKVSRLKFSVNIVRGGSPRPIDEYLTDGEGYNWIKIGDATGNGKYISATKQRIKTDGLSKTRLVEPGTLLLTNSMSFGHPYILNIKGCIHDGWLAFSNYSSIDRDFLYYYLMSDCAMTQFVQTVDGSVVSNLNIDKVRNALIAIPPINEQAEIARELDEQCAKIDIAIERHNTIISKLDAYRKSLIYHAVTGKIDCRKEANHAG